MECKSLRDSGEQIRTYDVAFFAASCDDLETNTKFAESLDLDYPILSDPDHKVAEAYGVVTPERRFPFRWTFYIGTDGTILAIDKEVQPATAGQAVAAKLAELDLPRSGRGE
jgi:peroxiredoxin Q/BCP